MAAASASLALAACGSGDSTVQTQPTPPVKQTTRDCTAVPRPAGCPDREPVVPMPLPGLTAIETNYAARALKIAATSFPLFGVPANGADFNTPQMVTWNYEPNSLIEGTTDQKMVDEFVMLFVEPSINAGQINYAFNFVSTDRVWLHNASGDVPFQNLNVLDKNPKFLINSVSKDNYITRNDIDLGFGDGWDSQIIKASAKTVSGSKAVSNPRANNAIDATLHTEVWSDYSSSNTADYLLGGVWLLMPNKIEDLAYARMGAFAQTNNRFGRVKDATTGTATYGGSMAGLHMTENNNAVPTIKRLQGDVSLTANFGTASEKGSIQGTITNLKLDGDSVTGSLSLPTAPLEPYNLFQPSLESKSPFVLGNIDSVNYQGRWQGVFHGTPNTANTAHPTGVVGTVGGTATNSSFVASFGAKKVEEEQ